MSLTINESGKAVTETIDGVTMPAELSFAVVNDFVHGVDVHFEEMQWLALGMAAHIEQMQERLRAAEAERDELWHAQGSLFDRLSVLTNENAELTNLLKSKNVDEYTLECIRLAQRARDFFDSASKKLTNQQDHGVLIEALARCRHQASYSIGDSDALSGQLSKIRDIVNETLNTRATK